jgi:hypothetical protein
MNAIAPRLTIARASTGNLDEHGRAVLRSPTVPRCWQAGGQADHAAIANVAVCGGRMRLTPMVGNGWRLQRSEAHAAAHESFGVFDIPPNTAVSAELRSADGGRIELEFEWHGRHQVSWRMSSVG